MNRLIKILLLMMIVVTLSPCGTGFDEETSSGDVSVNISAGQINVAVGATFSATFSAEVDVTTVTNKTFFIVANQSASSSLNANIKAATLSSQCHTDNALKGTISCASSGLSCTLTLDSLLQVETAYILCLTEEIRFVSPQLNGIFEGISESFTSQAGPHVEKDQENISIDSTFEQTFQTAVDTTTVTSNTFFVVPTTVEVVLNTKNLDPQCLAEKALNGTISCANDGLSCTLTLKAPLDYSSWYIFCATNKINSYAGSATAYKTQSASRFSVSGTISGLNGAVVLQNKGTDDLTLNTNGNFTFPQTLAKDTTYEVTVKTNPTSPAQTCTVSNGSGTINSANVTSVSVSCSTNDTTAPIVTRVSSSTSNGTYIAGNTINVVVTFSEAVTVTGTPTIRLETGATDRTASYSSGSGSTALTFVYTVQSGDTSTDLDYASTSALSAAGGTIRDSAENNATLTLPTVGGSSSLAGNAALVLDTTIPTVTLVNSSTSNGTYIAGNTINVVVTFSEAVTVTGTPTITLETGTTDRTASYSSGSGSTALTFVYTVQSGDSSTDLDYASTSALSAAGGTVKDSAGNNATLTLPTVGGSSSLAGNAALVVDASGPTAGGSGTLTASSLSTVSFTVSWTAATDNVTAQASLQYLLYRSTSNNLDTVSNIETNGTAVGSFTANITSTSLTGLSANTTYFFNVIVKDEAGNKTAYTSNSQATTNKMYLFSEGTNRNGDLKTAGAQSTARASGDSLCSTKKTASHSSLNCTNVRVFISISSSDEIRDFPTNYGSPTGVPIHSPNDTKIADDWNDLLDGSIDSSLAGAGVASADGNYWTGSDSSGALAGHHCAGFTNSDGGSFSGWGDSDQTDTSWLLSVFGNCNLTQPYLCLCW